MSTTLLLAYPVSRAHAQNVAKQICDIVESSSLYWCRFFVEPGIVDVNQPEVAKIHYDLWHNSTTRKGVRSLRVRIWLAPGYVQSGYRQAFFYPSNSERQEFEKTLAHAELASLENLNLENCRLVYSKQPSPHRDGILWSLSIFYKSRKYTK